MAQTPKKYRTNKVYNYVVYGGDYVYYFPTNSGKGSANFKEVKYAKKLHRILNRMFAQGEKTISVYSRQHGHYLEFTPKK